MDPDLIAVVPAAGRGSRLGLDVPKILAPLGDGRRVIDLLLERLAPVTRRVQLVLSPEGLSRYEALPPRAPEGMALGASVQDEPRGMGDAVMAAHQAFRDHPRMLVVWGDQVGLRTATAERAAAALRALPAPAFVVPLVERDAPYVHYRFDERGLLAEVLQAREGDQCPPRGRADVGLFGLTPAGLDEAFARYAATPGARGRHTGELNFLPLLPHLATREGWTGLALDVDDPDEARGLNTPADLAVLRARAAQP